jgi:spermidine/putrescine transport system permease protein
VTAGHEIAERSGGSNRAERGTPAVPGRRPRRSWRRGAADRPRVLWAVTGLTAVLLFVPIITVVVFSFNSRSSLTAFGHPSLRWYLTVARDSQLLASVAASIKIALVTMVVATLLGSLLAFGLVRARGRSASAAESMLLLTLVTPEIATGVALFLLFTTLRVTLSLTTVIVAHITFSIVYVTVIVRARLVGLSRSLEEAAMDLGATETQSLRLVVLPEAWPAMIGAGLLVFVLSFDDFVTSYFTTGVGVSPLPVYIYGLIRFGLSPEINAIGTAMMAGTIVIGILGLVLMRARGGVRSLSQRRRLRPSRQ